MEPKKRMKLSTYFDKFSTKVTKVAGSPAAFICALAAIVVWGVSGPLFDYSDTWQLVINTGTTVITFLMVFLIQQSQNKDTMALQLKLNELIACTKGASNRLIDIEDLTEEDLVILKKFYIELSELSKTEGIHATHSLDEAKVKHAAKQKPSKARVKEKQAK